jgi:hypothetical protein
MNEGKKEIEQRHCQQHYFNFINASSVSREKEQQLRTCSNVFSKFHMYNIGRRQTLANRSVRSCEGERKQEF